MNYIDCLRWMLKNGYLVLVKPAAAYHGCVEPQKVSLVEDDIAELEKRVLDDDPCFLRTGSNAYGEPVVWVFQYPRPADLESDVTELGPDELLPPYREESYDNCPYCQGQCPCFSGHAHIRLGFKTKDESFPG